MLLTYLNWCYPFSGFWLAHMVLCYIVISPAVCNTRGSVFLHVHVDWDSVIRGKEENPMIINTCGLGKSWHSMCIGSLPSHTSSRAQSNLSIHLSNIHSPFGSFFLSANFSFSSSLNFHHWPFQNSLCECIVSESDSVLCCSEQEGGAGGGAGGAEDQQTVPGLTAKSPSAPLSSSQGVLHLPSAAVCVGVLPGLWVYSGSSDSDSSSDSEGSVDTIMLPYPRHSRAYR